MTRGSCLGKVGDLRGSCLGKVSASKRTALHLKRSTTEECSRDVRVGRCDAFMLDPDRQLRESRGGWTRAELSAASARTGSSSVCAVRRSSESFISVTTGRTSALGAINISSLLSSQHSLNTKCRTQDMKTKINEKVAIRFVKCKKESPLGVKRKASHTGITFCPREAI